MLTGLAPGIVTASQAPATQQVDAPAEFALTAAQWYPLIIALGLMLICCAAMLVHQWGQA